MELFVPKYNRPIICDKCGGTSHKSVWTVKEVGRSTSQYVFCSDKCSDDFFEAVYVNKIRNEGL